MMTMMTITRTMIMAASAVAAPGCKSRQGPGQGLQQVLPGRVLTA